MYGRHQQAQESVRDYGHALQRLHERLVTKHSQSEALPAAQLRDRLIEGLLPGPLRRHLRRRATKNATMTFRAARDETLRFERDEAEDAPAVARVCEQREQPAADLDDRVAALADAVTKLAELTQPLQQEVAYQRRPNWREERASRYPEQRKRPLMERRRTAEPNDICWRCHHRRHFAAQCPGGGGHYRSYPGELQGACKYRHPNARQGNRPTPGLCRLAAAHRSTAARTCATFTAATRRILRRLHVVGRQALEGPGGELAITYRDFGNLLF